MDPRVPKPTRPTHPPYASPSPIAALYTSSAPCNPPPPPRPSAAPMSFAHPPPPRPIAAPLPRTHSQRPSAHQDQQRREAQSSRGPPHGVRCGSAAAALSALRGVGGLGEASHHLRAHCTTRGGHGRGSAGGHGHPMAAQVGLEPSQPLPISTTTPAPPVLGNAAVCSGIWGGGGGGARRAPGHGAERPNPQLRSSAPHPHRGSRSALSAPPAHYSAPRCRPPPPPPRRGMRSSPNIYGFIYLLCIDLYIHSAWGLRAPPALPPPPPASPRPPITHPREHHRAIGGGGGEGGNGSAPRRAGLKCSAGGAEPQSAVRGHCR